MYSVLTVVSSKNHSVGCSAITINTQWRPATSNVVIAINVAHRAHVAHRVYIEYIYCKTAKDSWRFNFVVFVVSYDPRN